MSAYSSLSASSDTRPALTNRQADFWLLGGASIVFWMFCHTLELLNPHFSTANAHLLSIPALFAFASLLINAPHFMASYHLAYSRGLPFIKDNWFQLVVVPVLLLVLLIIGDALFFSDIENWKAVGFDINMALEPLGIFLAIGIFDSFGPELLHIMASIMYLTVGWHYAKQVFGCFMVYSRFDGYALNGGERNLIKASLLAIWGYNFFASNIQISTTEFFSIANVTHMFPPIINLIFEAGTIALFILVAYRIFYRRWQDNGQLPPAPAVIAWIAMFIWWMPFTRSQTFFLFAVPFFHSLQYLPFYKKVIDAQHQDESTRARSFSFYFVFLVAAGFIAFNLGPEALDSLRASESRLTITYWAAGIALFINIHHYFIDNTIWRLSDPNVRKWLTS